MTILRKRLENSSKKYWPFLILILLIAIFFWKFFVFGLIPLPADIIIGTQYPWLDYRWEHGVVSVKNPITSDAISFIYPMRMLAVDLLKSGRLPLWNPYILSGTPLLANFQSAPFSVTTIFYFIFERLTAWSLQVIVQHFFAAIFTYFLLRHWRVSKLGSLFGSVVFAFSGFNIIFSQWNAPVLAASIIPLIILFTDRWLLFGKYTDGVGLTLALSVQIFSGYPQLVFYTLLSICLLFLVRFLSGDIRFWPAKAIFLVFFFLLGLGISAVQILPGLELISLSQRTSEPIPLEWVFLPLEKVITVVASEYFGNHASGNYWGPQNYTSNVGFVGITALTLSTLSFRSWRKKEVLVSILILISSLLLALKNPISLLFWKSNFLGIQAAVAHRSLVLFNLGTSLLVGFGVDMILSQKKMRFERVLIIPLLLIAFFAFSALFNFWSTRYNPQVKSDVPVYLIALLGLLLPAVIYLITVFIFRYIIPHRRLKLLALYSLLTLTVVELFVFGWKFTPFSKREGVYPTTPVIDFIKEKESEEPLRITGKEVMPVNLGMPYKFEFPGGYDAAFSEATAKLIAVLNSGDSSAKPQDRYALVENIDSKLIDLLNVSYILIKSDKAFDEDRFVKAFSDKSVIILENKKALPRANIFYDWQVVDPKGDILRLLISPEFPQDQKLILEEEIPLAKSSLIQDSADSISYLSYTEDYSAVEVKTEKEGLVFVSDTWYPGWKAFVDGDESKILRADYNFRAVYVPTGRHVVEFKYEPSSFATGLKISILSLVLLFAGSLAYKFLGNKRTKVYT